MPRSTPAAVLAALCCTVMFLYSVYLGAVGVLLPFLGMTFGLPEEAQGRLILITFLGFVIGVLTCGYLSDRTGRKRVLLLGTAVYALGLWLVGSSPSFGLALGAALLVGSGSGAMEVVANALATDLFPERRAFLLNLLQVAFGLGATLSPVLARHLLTQAISWRMLYSGLALLVLVAFVCLSLCRLPPTETREAVTLRALRGIFQTKAFAALCLAQALYVGGEVGFFSWMPTYLERTMEGGKPWVGWIATLFWLAMTVGRFALGGVLGRFPLLKLTTILAMGGAVFSGLAVIATQPVVLAADVVLAGLCFSGIFSLVLAETGERFPQVAGTAFGGVVAAGGVGGALLPWLMGGLVERMGWKAALLPVPIALLGVGVLTIALQRRRYV